VIELLDGNLRLGMRTQHKSGEPTTPGELLAEMDRLGISRALVRDQLAVETDLEHANRRLLDALAETDRLIPACALLPEATGETGTPVETVDEMIARGARGVWVYPTTHGYSLRDWCSGSLLSALETRRVPLFMLWQEVSVDDVAEVLARHEALDVVLTSISYRLNRVLYPLFEKHPNLHVDLAAPNASCGFIEQVVGRFGADRLIFGTGFPDHEAGPAITYLTYADIPDDDKRRIGAGNLQKLIEGVEQ